MIDYSEYSAPELVRMLGKKFKDFRILAKMTQKDVAEMTGLTIPTIQRFENGQSKNINLSTFLLLMKAVGSLNMLEELLTDEPESLYLYSESKKKIQRIRHKKR
ncbi:MAG: helix-turn-helix domain-containing protein [Muribaculaceae bacterium]|nr:helix-turn-helix domain-containing protein [Muribaculaceae bacterium]